MNLLIETYRHQFASKLDFIMPEECYDLNRPHNIVLESGKDITNTTSLTHSANVEREMETTNVPKDVLQTLLFTENSYADCVCYEETHDRTFEGGGTGGRNDSIQDFLARPTLIHSFSTLDVDQEFDPWSEFLTDTTIRPKLQNYSYIRGKLRLRFVWNATPFIYGRTLVSYVVGKNGGSGFSRFPSAGADLAQRRVNSVHLSQREIVGYIDPTNSVPLTLKLPFVYPTNFIDITGESNDHSLSNHSIGTITISNIVPTIKTDGATPAAIQVQVYAYMEDVELTVPTVEAPVTESGIVEPSDGVINKISLTETETNDDEYGGIISKPANVVSAVASKLEDVPVIGPFALSTKLAAGALADIAKLFGFSRPAEVSSTKRYYPQYTDNMATAIGDINSNMLTFDPKAELTIDPKTFGLGSVDELSIKHICCRYSIFRYVAWSTSDTASTLLESFTVVPSLSINSALYASYTPTKLFAEIFDYWRGSMIFKLDFVASAFHKGKVLIVYRPQQFGGTPIGLDSTNKAFSAIVDLSVTRSYEFVVGWAQAANWLATRSTTGTDNNYFSNGELQIRVMSPLTSPQDADIEIIMSVKAGNDIEFNSPNNRIVSSGGSSPGNTIITESGNSFGFDHPDMNTDESPVFSLVPTEKLPPEHRAIHFGDPVMSLRLYLKRFAWYFFPFSSQDMGVSTGSYINSIILPLYPMIKAESSNDPSSQTSESDFGPNPLPVIMACYAIVRGSMRYKSVLGRTSYDVHSSEVGLMRVQRIFNEEEYTGFSPRRLLFSENMRELYSFATSTNNSQCDDMAGAYVVPTKDARAQDFTIPYFSKYRFTFITDIINNSFTEPANQTAVFGKPVQPRFSYSVTGHRTSASGQPTNAMLASAIGEDFTLGYFSGVPIMNNNP